MEWVKWSIDALPEPKQRVLIAYRSGLVGAIEFFYNKSAKETYIKDWIWNKENPNAEFGSIGSALKKLSDDDPIIAWMPCPEAPKDNYEVV